MQQNMDLARLCAELADKSRQAAGWLKDNSESVGSESTSLQKDMRHTARFFLKCEQAARRKMCVGVFGPSQSGKSYLISTLARDARGNLMADFAGQSCDFITEINPEGGKESTGLVTRFTTTPPAGADPAFPIRLRLLTEADVVRVLANTYYADCEHKDAPEAEALQQALVELASRAGTGPAEDAGVSADDVEDIRDYCNKNFLSRPRVQLLQRGYWQQATELAPRLSLEDRARLFGLIWDSIPQFEALYLSLCSALLELGFPTEAGCPLSALIPRETSIIDVALLRGLGQGGDDLAVQGAAGRVVQLPRPVVTALTAEITIPMREKPDDFFDHTDLLDFPGYRSRLKLEDLRHELERPGTLENLFLRGKVAYLFERYCEEKELTSMLLCIGPGNQEVQDLPRTIHEWICATHGENPAHRAGKPPALFLVLTKMDLEFEKKKGTPSVESRWTTRLQSSLLDFFGKQHDWPTNWDGVHPFNNIFLLRNPNFRCEAIFDFEQEREVGVRPDQQAYVEEVRAAFLNSPLVQRHVAGPEQVWQAAMTLNDGGVSLLRAKLRPLCNPELKRQQIGVIVAEKREQTLARLAPFYKTSDREELRRQQEQLSRRLVALLAQLAEKQLFGEFLAALQVRDHDLHEICSRMGQEEGGDKLSPQAPLVGARVSASDILDDIFGDSSPASPAAAGGTAINQPEAVAQSAAPRDSAARFVQRVLEHWAGCLRELAGNADLRNRYALPPKELDQLCHELITAANRSGLRQQLEAELRRNAAYSNMTRERLVWKQVSLAADAINAFVDWLGFDPRFKGQDGRTILFGGKRICLFEPPAPVMGEPRIGEEEAPHDRLWYTDWLRALAWNVVANADFDGQENVNHEQNDRLYQIMQAFRS